MKRKGESSYEPLKGAALVAYVASFVAVLVLMGLALAGRL